MDTRRLWKERQGLIEEVRRLADEVLATADEAMERLTPPQTVAAALADDGRADRGRPAAGGRRGLSGAERLRTAYSSEATQSGSLPRALRPAAGALVGRLARAADGLDSRRPIGPGALPPALCPTPSVRSTPRCGPRERRGTRKPSTKQDHAHGDDDSDGHAARYPGLTLSAAGSGRLFPRGQQKQIRMQMQVGALSAIPQLEQRPTGR